MDIQNLIATTTSSEGVNWAGAVVLCALFVATAYVLGKLIDAHRD